MDRTKILEILGVQEGYYTEEYLNDEAIEQYNFLLKLTSALTKEEKEYLYSFCTCTHREFMAMVGYIAGEE